MKHRIILVIFSLLILLLVSCSEEHIHEFGEWESVMDAGCLLGGIDRRVCACGEVNTRYIEPLGHDVHNGVCHRCILDLKSSQINLERVIFTSRGDGTCAVTGYREKLDGSLEIPEYSPKGDRVTAISSEALSYQDITTLVIPASVETIGDAAFQNCNKLKTLIILGGVRSIGKRAFEGCGKLESIKLPDTLRNIGEIAFGYCSSLVEITLPDGVERIESNAFIGCRALTRVVISDSIISITNAFYGCTKLTKIYYKGTREQWESVEWSEKVIGDNKPMEIIFNYSK